jgi:hypothetical protein
LGEISLALPSRIGSETTLALFAATAIATTPPAARAIWRRLEIRKGGDHVERIGRPSNNPKPFTSRSETRGK